MAVFQEELDGRLPERRRRPGEIEFVQLGSPRRIRTILRTNARTAHAAARYQAQHDNAADRPYWMYDALEDGRARPHHLALGQHGVPARRPVLGYPLSAQWLELSLPGADADRRRRRATGACGQPQLARRLLAGRAHRHRRPSGGGDARERFADYVLPTIRQPSEVWLRLMADGASRRVFLGRSEDGRNVVVVDHWDGAQEWIPWTFYPRNHVGDRLRGGQLLYRRPE